MVVAHTIHPIKRSTNNHILPPVNRLWLVNETTLATYQPLRTLIHHNRIKVLGGLHSRTTAFNNIISPLYSQNVLICTYDIGKKWFCYVFFYWYDPNMVFLYLVVSSYYSFDCLWLLPTHPPITH